MLYRWDGERLTECRVEQDYAGGPDDRDHLRGFPSALYVSGPATVRDGAVTDVRAVTDRLAAERRMAAKHR